MASERLSLNILPVKKEAKLSASEVPGEDVVGSGEEDLRCRSLLTVCQRRLGLSEAEDMRLEKYSFWKVMPQRRLVKCTVDYSERSGGKMPSTATVYQSRRCRVTVLGKLFTPIVCSCRV